MMKFRCLYCYKFLDEEVDFHKACSLAFFGTPVPPRIEYSLNQMAEMAKHVVERSVSVPGVQAKISMTIVKSTQGKSDTRLTVVGALGGNFIFKPPSLHFPELPANEHLTMKIADAFSIRVVPSSLIRLASGEISYITKRIDRLPDGQKIHMLDMFQITEAFDKYKSSMEKVGTAIDSFSENTQLDKLFYFELALFSFLTGNNDMHLKNFSMIEKSTGWALAPAYDLINVNIANPIDEEELALTLNGKRKRLKKSDFEQLGKRLGLTDKQTSGVFSRFVKNKHHAFDMIDQSFLSEEMKLAYKKLLEKKYDQLGLVESSPS